MTRSGATSKWIAFSCTTIVITLNCTILVIYNLPSIYWGEYSYHAKPNIEPPPGYPVLLCTTLHCSKPVYTDEKSNHMVVVVLVVWYSLPIIEPPHSILFNSGLNLFLAIMALRSLLLFIYGKVQIIFLKSFCNS